MCYFITIGVPAADLPLAMRLAPRGFHTIQVANQSVLAALPNGYGTFLLCSGGCSCGLYQDAAEPNWLAPDAQRLKAKYQKKGWSEEKVRRALEQSIADHAAPTTFVGFREDVIGVLQALSAQVGRLAVHVHWYDERVEESRIDLQPTVSVASCALPASTPGLDRLIWVSSD